VGESELRGGSKCRFEESAYGERGEAGCLLPLDSQARPQSGAWASRATFASGRNRCGSVIDQAPPSSERRSAFRSFFVFFFLSSSSHLAGDISPLVLHHRSPVHMPSIFVPSASQTRTAFRTFGLGSSTACGGCPFLSFKEQNANREALSSELPRLQGRLPAGERSCCGLAVENRAPMQKSAATLIFKRAAFSSWESSSTKGLPPRN
jgi:hypothetical protein